MLLDRDAPFLELSTLAGLVAPPRTNISGASNRFAPALSTRLIRGSLFSRAISWARTDDESLGGSALHYVTTGLDEYLAENDTDSIRIAREIVAKRRPGSGRAAKFVLVPVQS